MENKNINATEILELIFLLEEYVIILDKEKQIELDDITYPKSTQDEKIFQEYREGVRSDDGFYFPRR